MRLTGWEWWPSLLATVFSGMVPLLGQIVYIVFTFMGLYYLQNANWEWRRAVDALPKTFSIGELSPTQFERLKTDTIKPQLIKQCMEDAKVRFGHEGKISIAAARFCECYTDVAISITTQQVLLYQEANNANPPGHRERMDAAVRQKCAGSGASKAP